MGFLSRIRESLGAGRSAPGGLHLADARFDDWAVVRDFEEIESARAWHQQLEEAGVDAVLTSDWPLDRFGRGDIALRVPPELWQRADELLSAAD